MLGTYRPHDAVVHPGAIVHPGGTTVLPHPHFVVPDYKEWLKGKDAYLKKVSDAKLKARYQYAWDTCARRGKMWGSKRRYKCFRMMYAQYKPNKSNSLNAVRDRVQRDCMRYAENPILRAKCFDEHIKNYEERLLAKKKKVASLMEAGAEEN